MKRLINYFDWGYVGFHILVWLTVGVLIEIGFRRAGY